MRIALAVAFVLACACTKKDKADCDAYADRVVQLGSPGLTESRIASVKLVAREACEKGEVTASEARCVIAAASHDESLRCHGVTTTSAAPPSGPRARGPGFSVAIPAGLSEGNAQSNTLSLHSDKIHVFLMRVNKSELSGTSAVASDDACRSANETSSKRSDLTLISAALVDTRLGKSCRARLQNPGAAVLSDTILIGGGDQLAITCAYDVHEANPPAVCKEVFDSLTLD